MEELVELLKPIGVIKTSPLDPIPASLLNKVLPVLLSSILSIINKSLQEGSMEGARVSTVIPILKKKVRYQCS